MKIKYITLAILAMFGFSGCNEEYAKVPFSVEVDLSKKGTVYETDFQAPWNIWGSWVSFNLGTNITWETLDSYEGKVFNLLRTGYKDGVSISEEENQYFKLKVTLTPLGWASDNMTIWSGASWFPEMTKKEFKDGEKIEFIATVPLYGWGITKTIMIADLQRLRNYHIRVESLEDVELPRDVKTTFEIRKHSRKV